jgi:hypothetical protein
LPCEPVIENPCLPANDPSVSSTKDTIRLSCVSWLGQIRCPLTTEPISKESEVVSQKKRRVLTVQCSPWASSGSRVADIGMGVTAVVLTPGFQSYV